MRLPPVTECSDTTAKYSSRRRRVYDGPLGQPAEERMNARARIMVESLSDQVDASLKVLVGKVSRSPSRQRRTTQST